MKKRLENIWYYYKWYIISAIVAVVVISNYFVEKSKIIEPDCQIGIVTKEYIPESIRDNLGELIGKIWGDTNGDGTCYAAVNFYQYDAQTMSAKDADGFMASAVQLAADIKKQVSIWYITDSPKLLLNADSELIKGKNYKDFSELMKIGADELKDFVILERVPQGQELSQKLF